MSRTNKPILREEKEIAENDPKIYYLIPCCFIFFKVMDFISNYFDCDL